MTNATDEKDKFFIRDELKKNLAILEVTYVEQEVAITYVQFIGVKDTLVSAEITALRNSLYEKGVNIYLSIVDKQDTKIIDEIYKTAKDDGQSDDKDYSVETGVPKEVNDLFIRAVKQGVSDIHWKFVKGLRESEPEQTVVLLTFMPHHSLNQRDMSGVV